MSYKQQLRERFSSVSGRTTEVIHEHKKWQHPHHFVLMLCVASTMIDELSNFPIRCFMFGKLIYFIIYAILYFTIGIPMVILECQLAQYFGQSGLNLLRHICPLAGGLGIIQVLTLYAYLIRSHYKTTVFINYVFSSTAFEAPWQTCGHIWSRINCYTKFQYDKCYAIEKYFWNNTCTDPKKFCEGVNMIYENDSFCLSDGKYKFIPLIITSNYTSPGWDYFFYKVRSVYSGESIDVYFFCTLTLGWVLTVICCFKGIHKTGVQVSYFLYFTSNLIFFVLLFIILLNSGGFKGIAYGFDYDYRVFADLKTWLMAMNEVIKTLNIGFGTNALLASYNNFHTNLIPLIYSSGGLIILLNQFTYTIFVYALWGVSSVNSVKSLQQISDPYQGLLAILAMIPDLVQLLPFPHLWAFLYCVATACRVVGTNMVVMEALVISLCDISDVCNTNPRFTRFTLAFLGWSITVFGPFIDPSQMVGELFSAADYEFEMIAMVELLIFGLLYGFASDLKYRHFSDLEDMLRIQTKFRVYLQIAYYIMIPLIVVIYITLRTWTLNIVASVTAILIIEIIYVGKTPIIIICYGIYILVTTKYKKNFLKSVITPSVYWTPQQSTLQHPYVPKYKPGSWKYKFAMLANHFGFQL